MNMTGGTDPDGMTPQQRAYFAAYGERVVQAEAQRFIAACEILSLWLKKPPRTNDDWKMDKE
jgi:hypothetical protein